MQMTTAGMNDSALERSRPPNYIIVIGRLPSCRSPPCHVVASIFRSPVQYRFYVVVLFFFYDDVVRGSERHQHDGWRADGYKRSRHLSEIKESSCRIAFALVQACPVGLEVGG
jgi:hypothetical protein